jgi:hypothetical protein
MPITSRDLRGWFYIFTSLQLVHTSTQTFPSSVFDLASFWSPNFRPRLPNFGDLYLWFRRSETSELYWSLTPDLRRFMIPDDRGFMIPDLRRFLNPDHCMFKIQVLRGFMIPDLHRFTIQVLRRFMIFLKLIVDSRKEARNGCYFHILPQNLSHKLCRTRRSVGVRFSTKFPNTSPSGKRVYSDDPVPRKLLNSGEKRHPWNVGVDMRPSENSQRSNRGDFLKLPPSPW